MEHHPPTLQISSAGETEPAVLEVHNEELQDILQRVKNLEKQGGDSTELC